MRFCQSIPVAILLMLVQSAFATRIQDITRFDGERSNILTGMGLVVGLKGTGDGADYLPTVHELAQLRAHLSNPAGALELADAKNVALVSIYATLPGVGVRNGDHLDVRIASTRAATSLKGGTLYIASMMGPTGKPYISRDEQGNALPPIPFATATGSVELEDPTMPNNGIVKGGAVMEVSLPTRYIDSQGRFTLIIDEPSASWSLASSMAKLINESSDSGETIAIARDPKNVTVQIPVAERADPASFIANVLQMQVQIPMPRVPVQIAQTPAKVSDVPHAVAAIKLVPAASSSLGGQWGIRGSFFLIGWLGALSFRKLTRTAI